MEYPCESPDGLRWFQLRVTRPGPARIPRIVVAHEDITDSWIGPEGVAAGSSAGSTTDVDVERPLDVVRPPDPIRPQDFRRPP